MSADMPAIPSLPELQRARARREAAGRRLMPLALLVVLVLLVSASRVRPGPGLHGDSLGVSVALGLLAVAAIAALVIPRAPVGVQVGLAVMMLASAAALLWLQPSGLGAFALVAGAAAAARRVQGRLGGVLAGGALVLLIGEEAGHRGTRPISSVILSAVGLAAVYLAVLLAQRLRKGDYQVERLLIELEESRDAEVRTAALVERQRLARDMHDVLAHSLSGLLLQLEGARLLAAEDPHDPRLSGTIDRAHQLARTGLAEASSAIAMLRGDEFPGPERLATLAAEFERDRAIPCVFELSGDRRDLDAQVNLTLYRVTQEALTNVGKHASAERVLVQLRYDPQAVELTIEDVGAGDGDSIPSGGAGAADPGPGRDAAPGGYGLTGMAERAELLGGSLTAAPSGHGGFRVELRIPA